MLRFGKDLLLDVDRSKFTHLAVSYATRNRGAIFGDAASADLSVVQCGDGRIVAPDGFRKWRYVAICHDLHDKYREVLDGASDVICIGCCRDGAKCIDTYPLDEYDRHRLPKSPDGLTVCGGTGTLYADDGISGTVVSFNGMRGSAPFNYSREMLLFYYRTATRIIHCGNGNGTGYLGALAAWHCPNGTIFANGNKPNKVTYAEEFDSILRAVT